jgi:hypothetical protein
LLWAFHEQFRRFFASCFGFLSIAVVLVIPLLMLYLCIYHLRMLLWLLRARGWWRIDEAAWQAMMKTGNPVEQHRYLQVDRSRFAPHPLSPSEYLALLIAVESKVTEDPAATLYWRLRQEMEQATRHHEQP